MQINKRQIRQHFTSGKHLGGPLTGSHINYGPVVPSHCEGHSSIEQLENPLPIVNNLTSLDERTTLEDE